MFTHRLAKILFFMCVTEVLIAQQTAVVVGFVSEDNNRGFLAQVDVVAVDRRSGFIAAKSQTDLDGKFELAVPIEAVYELRYSKRAFEDKSDTLSTVGINAGTRLFVKTKMSRKPGYIFEATMAAQAGKDNIVPAINLSTIEIYNQTADSVALLLENYNSPFFSFTLEQGNHYTMLIRAPGFLPKRIEAYVNVEGCILCLDGVGGVRPGVTDNLTAGHQMGVLLANLSLEPAPKNHSDWRDNYSLADLITLEKVEKMQAGTLMTSSSPDNTQFKRQGQYESRLDSYDYSSDAGLIRMSSSEAGSPPAMPTQIVVDESGVQSQTTTSTAGEDIVGNAQTLHEPLASDTDFNPMPQTGQGDNAPFESKPAHDAGVKPQSIEAMLQNWTLVISNQPDTPDAVAHGQTETHDSKNRLLHANNRLYAAASDDEDRFDTQLGEPTEKVSLVTRQLAPQTSGYLIQLLSTKEPLTAADTFRLARCPSDELFTEQYGSYTAYLVGVFDNRFDAEAHLEDKIKALFPLAFVVKYVDGQRI